MGIADYSTTAASNTSINGINIAEGWPAANINNAIRQLMADIAADASNKNAVSNYTAAQNWAKGTDIASASTTDIGAATGNYVTVTGTTTITALGIVQAGAWRVVRFSGVLTLTHNSTSLILPTAANITTAAGDTALFISEGSGNWRCVSFQRADGSALVGYTLADGDVTTAKIADSAVTTAKIADASLTIAKLASGVLDTDGTLSADSDSKIPSQKAIKTYVDSTGEVFELLRVDASGSSALPFTGYLTTTYKKYIIELIDIVPATTGGDIGVQFGSGGTYYAASHVWQQSSVASNSTTATYANTSASYIRLSGAGGVGTGTAANGFLTGTLEIYNPAQNNGLYHISLYRTGTWDGSNHIYTNGSGRYIGGVAMSDVRIISSSGNIASGTAILYGLK